MLQFQLSYRRFNDSVSDVRAVADRLSAALAKTGFHQDLGTRVFSIDTRSLPELSGVFSALHTSSFEAQIDGAARLVYSDHQLELQGQLDSMTLSVVREALLFGF